MFTSYNDQGAVLVGNFTAWTLVHIQVTGPAAIRIGANRGDLDGGQGLTILPEMNVVSLWWFGQLWAMGNAPASPANIVALSGGRPS